MSMYSAPKNKTIRSTKLSLTHFLNMKKYYEMKTYFSLNFVKQTKCNAVVSKKMKLSENIIFFISRM